MYVCGASKITMYVCIVPGPGQEYRRRIRARPARPTPARLVPRLRATQALTHAPYQPIASFQFQTFFHTLQEVWLQWIPSAERFPVDKIRAEVKKILLID